MNDISSLLSIWMEKAINRRGSQGAQYHNPKEHIIDGKCTSVKYRIRKISQEKGCIKYFDWFEMGQTQFSTSKWSPTSVS